MNTEKELLDRKLAETVKAFPVTAWDMLVENSERVTEGCGIIHSLLLPPMQRQYIWGASQAEQLIKDIINAPENSPHYLGMIQGNLTTNGRQNVLEVVEGQQRLTTLLIWYLSAFHWLADNAASELDIPEPGLNTNRLGYVAPAFAGKTITLNSEPNEADSLSEMSIIDPEESPEIAQRKMREVFRFFLKWWDENLMEHPDAFVREMLQENTAFLLVIAPRFASPQRFVAQSKNISLTTYDKLVANMMEQHPQVYKNDVSANVELAWLRENVKAFTEGKETERFLELASKWDIATEDQKASDLRKQIASLKVKRDFDEGERNVEREVFESLADTLWVDEVRRPIWARKATKSTLEDDYHTVLANAVDSIGFGFAHSRHRDSNHEGTSKSNTFSKTLGFKGDPAIEAVAKQLVFDPEPVKERLARLSTILESVHDRFKNYHNHLRDHETNIASMFSDKQIQNVLGTLAYYPDNNEKMIEGVIDSCIFVQAWICIVELVHDKKELLEKWENILCALIERSGRREWTDEHIKRMEEMSRLMVCEMLVLDAGSVGADIEKMRTYILDGDVWLKTEEKSMALILEESFAKMLEMKKGEFEAFDEVHWKSAIQDFNKTLKMGQWFVWAVDSYPNLFISKQAQQALESNGIEYKAPRIWSPSKAKPFTKDAPTAEHAMWLFEPSSHFYKEELADMLFLAAPITDIDMLRSEQEGIFAGKLGAFTEGESIEIDEDIHPYAPNMLGAMLSIAIASTEEGYRNERKYKEEARRLFMLVMEKTFSIS